MGADGVTAERSWNDKCLGIMHDQWRELPLGALHDHFITLAEIEHIDASVGVVWNCFAEPVASSLDELTYM